MKTRYLVQIGFAAAAALLLSACSTTDPNVNTVNQQAARTDSAPYNAGQYTPQTPTTPIGGNQPMMRR